MFYLAADIAAQLNFPGRMQYSRPPPSSEPAWIHDLGLISKSNRSIIDRELIRFLIAKTLITALSTPGNDPHQKLMLRYPKKRWQYPKPVGFISLNWDTTLESTLERLGFAAGFGFVQTDGGRKRVPFAKPHGSLDWFVCRACGSTVRVPLLRVSFAWDGPIKSWDSATGNPWSVVRCKMCEGNCIPAFLPPTAEKLRVQEPFKALFRAQWTHAFQLLEQAEIVRFIGYSFPLTDSQFMLLMRLAIERNRQLKRVEVITPPKSGNPKASYESRVQEIFSHKVHFVYQRYEHWAAAIPKKAPLENGA